MNARNAVKGFIVKDNQLLIVKRCSDEDESPNIWELPGGRLEIGENPQEGLKREIKEEVGLDVQVLNPLRIHHFNRACGQTITMIVFLCEPINDEVKISNEHSDYLWIPINNCKEKLIHFFHEEVDIYNKFFKKD